MLSSYRSVSRRRRHDVSLARRPPPPRLSGGRDHGPGPAGPLPVGCRWACRETGRREADAMWYLDREGFGRFLRLLAAQGYEVIGPTVRDGAIVLERIEGVADLPAGVREVQGPAVYRARADGRRPALQMGSRAGLGEAVPVPAPRSRLERSRETGQLTLTPPPLPETKYAFVGLRSCDLHAIDVQDRVFMIADPAYRTRREASVFIGVNCEVPGETCFCASMGTGPRCSLGYDLSLTELDDGFTVEAGTPRGEELLDGARGPSRVRGRGARLARGDGAGGGADGARGGHLRHAGTALPQPRAPALGRRRLAMPRVHELHDGLPHVLLPRRDRLGIDRPARRPTRTREWASCFSEEFSHMASGDVRTKRAVALPAMAHAQVRVVDRPVRHVGLRRLRPVHHVVSRSAST